MANEETQQRTNRLEVVDRSYHSASVYYRQRQILAWSLMKSNVVEVFSGQNDSSVVTLAVVGLETKRWRAANGVRRSADQQNTYCTELDRKHLTLRKRKCFSPCSSLSLPSVQVRVAEVSQVVALWRERVLQAANNRGGRERRALLWVANKDRC